MRAYCIVLPILFFLFMSRHAQGSDDPYLVREINPTPNPTSNSDPNPGVFLGSAYIFSATSPNHGRELWRFDGTNTTLIKDIHPGLGSGVYSDLIHFNGSVYFAGHDGETGIELWKTDGTENGTVMVADINPLSSEPWDSFGLDTFTTTTQYLFFDMDDGVHGRDCGEPTVLKKGRRW